MNFQPVTPHLEPLMSAAIMLATPLSVGATGLGERRIIAITGGHFTGAQLSGEILPGGADWQLVRPDGAALLDARYTLRTNDDALIYVRNRGVRQGPRAVLDRLAQGEAMDPASYYFRTTPTFETGHPQYSWLNDIIAVCSGVRTANAVLIDFYVVR